MGPNPTDRGKNGTKKTVLVDGQGGPLAVSIDPANCHDSQCLEGLLNNRVVPSPAGEQHLYLDRGYDTPGARRVAEKFGYVVHICGSPRDREPQACGPRRRFRWVVERTLAWLSKCRGLLVRYIKKAENFLGLLQLACCLLWYRRLRQCVQKTKF